MSLTLNSGRQFPLVATVAFDYASLASGVNPAIELPPGAIVTGGFIVIETAFDSGTSDSIDVGDGVDDDRYTPTIVDAQVAGAVALTPTGYVYTGADVVDLTFTPVGTARTQGAGYLLVEYVIRNRAHEVNP